MPLIVFCHNCRFKLGEVGVTPHGTFKIDGKVLVKPIGSWGDLVTALVKVAERHGFRCPRCGCKLRNSKVVARA